MGAYVSEFSDNGDPLVRSSPNKSDWITAHATVTALAIVEVERLWARFQQLGCNAEGILTDDVLKKPPASEDVFVKNILTTFRNQNGDITFQSFLNAMKWAETADLDTKLRAAFNLMNNGAPVNNGVLLKVLKTLYSEDSTSEIQQLADTFMNEMDETKRGEVTQEQFLRWVKRMPRDTLEGILDFHIIPPAINDDAHRMFSSITSLSRRSGGSISKQVPTDRMLMKIAKKIHKRDWHVVANRLGFTNIDIGDFEMRHPSNSSEQAYQMLCAWRQREGTSAYAKYLERALHVSQMHDAALLLHP